MFPLEVTIMLGQSKIIMNNKVFLGVINTTIYPSFKLKITC